MLAFTVAHKCYGKSKFITARANSARKEQIHHGKSKFNTARANSSRQEKIHHGKSKLPTTRANYPRQNTPLKTHRLFQVDINRREQCCAVNYEQVVNHVVPSCYS
jgi:recombination DNA repair RAD52 pathway protein